MEIGIFSRTYETTDLDDTFRRMKKDGLCRTQFNFQNCGLYPLPESIPDRVLDEIREKSEAYGIILDVLTGTFNMIDPDREARERAIRQFERQIYAAEALGIPVVSLCTGSRSPKGKWNWDNANLEESAMDDLMRTTDKIILMAEDAHVILGVEPEASNIIHNAELARNYLDRVGSPALKIIMDGANLFQPGAKEDMETVLFRSFDLLGKDIVSAHAKDLVFDREISFVAAGEGCLDFAGYITLLKVYGYDGPLIMHGLSEKRVTQSREFLQRLIG